MDKGSGNWMNKGKFEEKSENKGGGNIWRQDRGSLKVQSA